MWKLYKNGQWPGGQQLAQRCTKQQTRYIFQSQHILIMVKLTILEGMSYFPFKSYWEPMPTAQNIPNSIIGWISDSFYHSPIALYLLQYSHIDSCDVRFAYFESEWLETTSPSRSRYSRLERWWKMVSSLNAPCNGKQLLQRRRALHLRPAPPK